MKSFDKSFMGPPKALYCQEIEKLLRSNPVRFIALYQTGKLFGKYKLAATGAIAANCCRETNFSLCDTNIFRPHDFPLPSGNIDTAPVNHPVMVKISDQPHSVLLIFRRSLLLRLCAKPN
jgi:hypothetical protein